jgi:hypothetical protein
MFYNNFLKSALQFFYYYLLFFDRSLEFRQIRALLLVFKHLLDFQDGGGGNLVKWLHIYYRFLVFRTQQVFYIICVTGNQFHQNRAVLARFTFT